MGEAFRHSFSKILYMRYYIDKDKDSLAESKVRKSDFMLVLWSHVSTRFVYDSRPDIVMQMRAKGSFFFFSTSSNTASSNPFPFCYYRHTEVRSTACYTIFIPGKHRSQSWINAPPSPPPLVLIGHLKSLSPSPPQRGEEGQRLLKFVGSKLKGENPDAASAAAAAATRWKWDRKEGCKKTSLPPPPQKRFFPVAAAGRNFIHSVPLSLPLQFHLLLVTEELPKFGRGRGGGGGFCSHGDLRHSHLKCEQYVCRMYQKKRTQHVCTVYTVLGTRPL